MKKAAKCSKRLPNTSRASHFLLLTGKEKVCQNNNAEMQETPVSPEGCKGIEQRHLFPLYQSVVISSVNDCGPGLTATSQTNLLMLDRVQNEATTVIPLPLTTKDNPFRPCGSCYICPPMHFNQTESGAGHSILQCGRKSPQPTPWSCEKHQRMQTGMGQVLDRSGRGISTASAPADGPQANWGVERLPWLIPAPLCDTPARKPGKALLSRQNGVRDQASHSRIQQTTGSHTQCTDVTQSPKTSEGGASLSSKVQPISRKTAQPSL